MKTVALVIAFSLLGSATSGYALSGVTPKSQELSLIQVKINEANQSIEQIKIEREKLIAQLQEIEKQYGATAGSLRGLGLQISGKQQRLKSISREMEQRQAELKLQSSALARQVKAAFVMGKKEQLRLLLNQQDPALASRMMVYYNYLNKNRLDKLAAIKSNIAQLASLEQEKQRETSLLGQAIQSHKTVKVGLNKTKKQRELLLAKLSETFKKKSHQLDQLDENALESQALIDKLQQAALEREKVDNSGRTAVNQPNPADGFDADGNPVNSNAQKENKTAAFDVDPGKSFSELKGRLPLPVTGAIVKRFGSQRAVTRWDGILISANEGTDIRAVTGGRVAFANWLRGYGLLIILDHGHGYLTLYAFNQSLYKKVGEYVKAGTVIAAVGNSGGREESGLYFGIRSKGKPVDPMIWCKKG